MKRMIGLTLGVGIGLAATGTGVGCALSTPRPRAQPSDHFDGRRFHNPSPEERGGLGDLLKWMRTRERGHWEEHPDAPSGPPPPSRVEGGAMRVTFVNHATTLIQADGVNVLTDPIWSARASPVSFAGPKRVRPPGIRFEDLPPIDVVVISHNHYDHLDVATLKRLKAQHGPRFVVPLGNRSVLEKAGILGAVELDWWEGYPVRPGVKIVAVPARHFSNRGPFDDGHGLWAGFAIEGPSGRALFAGDTGYGPQFKEIARRLGPSRVAMLPIGAYLPRWFMSPVHMSPEEAVQAARDLQAGTSVAVHFGTFQLADDSQEQPVEELAKALEGAGELRFWVLGFGEGREVP